MDYEKLTATHTRLRSLSACHPNKRGEEIARFGKPDTQAQLKDFLVSTTKCYLVGVFKEDDLAIALVRSYAKYQQSFFGPECFWLMSVPAWAKETGLARRGLDRTRKQLQDNKQLSLIIKGFPPAAFYCYHNTTNGMSPLSEFTYHPALAKPLGYKAAAFFGWLAAMDHDLEAQGYFFHRPLGDIQAALGLSRFQLDQARKTLIDHHLMQERYWGIPAVREFRIKLDGLPALLDQINSQEQCNGS
ncbi:MAG: hypothetical protein KZQ96_22650 [Candidatus Thiodiazotropha sp. (ex Lucinoma borealis)]|nr:hypothetical protein [Candidatus Thiodiazotropha sp. (ex Lucinoma borealis)]